MFGDHRTWIFLAILAQLPVPGLMDWGLRCDLNRRVAVRADRRGKWERGSGSSSPRRRSWPACWAGGLRRLALLRHILSVMVTCGGLSGGRSAARRRLASRPALQADHQASSSRTRGRHGVRQRAAPSLRLREVLDAHRRAEMWKHDGSSARPQRARVIALRSSAATWFEHLRPARRDSPSGYPASERAPARRAPAGSCRLGSARHSTKSSVFFGFWIGPVGARRPPARAADAA